MEWLTVHYLVVIKMHKILVLLLKTYIKYSNITSLTLQVSATTSSVKLIDDFEPEDDVRISFKSNGFLIIPLLLEST